MSVCECEKTEREYPELDEVLGHYAQVKGSLITVLQKAQDLYGYLPEDVIQYIAKCLSIASAKVYGVATFYTQFRLVPIGTYLIMLCEGTACHVNGASVIEEAIIEHLGISDGQTTPDGIFTLNIVACLGCCSLAPVVMVKGPEGDETYGRLTKNKIIKVLDEIAERVLGAQPGKPTRGAQPMQSAGAARAFELARTVKPAKSASSVRTGEVAS